MLQLQPIAGQHRGGVPEADGDAAGHPPGDHARRDVVPADRPRLPSRQGQTYPAGRSAPHVHRRGIR